MRIIPAIDLFQGRIVRLTKGDPGTARYYEAFGDPVDTSKHWEREGARFLHVVDLDAAIGRGDNKAIICRILGQVNIPVQVGGGLRRPKDVLEILDWGASRIVLGTLVFEQLGEFAKLLNEVGNERLVVALDYLEDRIVTMGWTKRTEQKITDSLESFLRIGARMFLLTSVGRDGLLAGPDLRSLSRCTRIPEARIIAAGGIASLEDLVRLSETGVEEVVVGKALYEGRIKLRDALDLFPD